MRKPLLVLAAFALCLSAFVGEQQPAEAATPALVQAQLASTASTTGGLSVTLTNVQAGSVLFAWTVMDARNSAHNSVADSATLGWHPGITSGPTGGYEQVEAYWPPNPPHVAVRGLWANVPAALPSLTVYMDFQTFEPGATFIVSEWTGVQPQVARRNHSDFIPPNSACGGAGTTTQQPSYRTYCTFPTTAPPGVRIFCTTWEAPAVAVSNGVSNWTTVATTETYGARCVYKVATTTGAARNPEVDYSAATTSIGYGFTLYS